jgi:multiple sugar transport system ATP-binding protein
MGRAVAREPKAFLMDEPLSNLDAKLRVGMRASLAQLHARLGVTTVYVTHDQTEAMTLGRRVAVMRDGQLLQVDEPARLYQEPRDLFVGAFIGSPAMNLVEAVLDGSDVVFGQFRVPLAPERTPRPASGRLVLGIRPEAFAAAALARPGLPRIAVEAEVVEDLGADVHVLFGVRAPRVAPETPGPISDDASILAEEEALFTARIEPAAHPRVGDRLELAVDPARLYFFDAETGNSLVGAAAPPPAAALAGVG